VKTANLIAPSGRRYRVRFDGCQDFRPAPAGIQRQFTALEEIPGLAPQFGTTYAATICRCGFRIQHQEEAA